MCHFYLIEQSEKPKRYLITVPNVYLVADDKALFTLEKQILCRFFTFKS